MMAGGYDVAFGKYPKAYQITLSSLSKGHVLYFVMSAMTQAERRYVLPADLQEHGMSVDLVCDSSTSYYTVQIEYSPEMPHSLLGADVLMGVVRRLVEVIERYEARYPRLFDVLARLDEKARAEPFFFRWGIDTFGAPVSYGIWVELNVGNMLCPDDLFGIRHQILRDERAPLGAVMKLASTTGLSSVRTYAFLEREDFRRVNMAWYEAFVAKVVERYNAWLMLVLALYEFHRRLSGTGIKFSLDAGLDCEGDTGYIAIRRSLDIEFTGNHGWTTSEDVLVRTYSGTASELLRTAERSDEASFRLLPPNDYRLRMNPNSYEQETMAHMNAIDDYFGQIKSNLLL